MFILIVNKFDNRFDDRFDDKFDDFFYNKSKLYKKIYNIISYNKITQ